MLLLMVPDEKYSNSAELNNTKSVLGAKLILISLQSAEIEESCEKEVITINQLSVGINSHSIFPLTTLPHKIIS